MQHKHTNACGHTDDEHDKINRAKDKLDAAMVDIAGDMLSEGDVDNLLKIIKSKLKRAGAGSTSPYIKAFAEGFEFGMFASAKDNDSAMPCIAGMRLIIKRENDKVKAKVDASTKA